MRQWSLLKALPNRGPGLSARQLTEHLREQGYEVSKRTVERDLRDLSQHFAIYENAKSKPYGWRWLESATMAIPGISIPEALSLQIAQQSFQHLLPPPILQSLKPRLEQALNLLEQTASKNRMSAWRDKIGVREPALPFIPPEINPETLATLQLALLEDRQVEATYMSALDGQIKQLRLHPLGLIQRGVLLYLAATAFNYQDILLYAVHRFSSTTMTDDDVLKPEGFNLRHFIEGGAMEFAAGKSMRLKAKVHKELAFHLRETPLSGDMVITGEGDWLSLRVTLCDSWQLRWWILSQGASIAIESPVWLRRYIKTELKTTLALYKRVASP